MKNFIRAALFTLGFKTTATIVAPIAKIVEDLDAFSDHLDQQVSIIGNRQQVLVQQKRAIQVEQSALTTARAHINALITP